MKLPNAGKANYDVIFRQLLQSDSGANVMVSVNDKIKGSGYDPELVIKKNEVQFRILHNEKYLRIVITY